MSVSEPTGLNCDTEHNYMNCSLHCERITWASTIGNETNEEEERKRVSERDRKIHDQRKRSNK